MQNIQNITNNIKSDLGNYIYNKKQMFFEFFEILKNISNLFWCILCYKLIFQYDIRSLCLFLYI